MGGSVMMNGGVCMDGEVMMNEEEMGFGVGIVFWGIYGVCLGLLF